MSVYIDYLTNPKNKKNKKVSEKVEEFWEYRQKRDKQFNRFIYVMVALYILLFILNFFDKLSVGVLFFGTLISFCFLVWLASSDTSDLHNRINILDEQTEELENKVDDLYYEFNNNNNKKI